MKESYLVPDPIEGGTTEVLKQSDLSSIAKPIRRGKIRDVYDFGEHLAIVTTDRISAFDVVLPTLIPHKGQSLNKLSAYWFNNTERIFPNHFVELMDERTMKVLKAERVDIEWVCRAYLYGSAWRAYKDGARSLSGVRLPDGLAMAGELPQVIVTPTTKAEVGHDKEISRAEAIEAKLVTRDEWRELEEATYRLFDFYKATARSRGLIIPDFKLEFGRIKDGLIQIDEPPTHDSARFWAENLYEPGVPQEAHCIDKEFLREYLRRVGYTGDGAPPELPPPVVREVSKRCVASYEVLSGNKELSDFELRMVDEIMEEVKG